MVACYGYVLYVDKCFLTMNCVRRSNARIIFTDFGCSSPLVLGQFLGTLDSYRNVVDIVQLGNWEMHQFISNLKWDDKASFN